MIKRKLQCITFIIMSLLMAACVSDSQNILYVNADAQPDGDGSSWGNAYSKLQDALDVAQSGNEIWVAAGTYIPTKKVGGDAERKRSFQLKSGVALYGGFNGTETSRDQRDWNGNKTILNGDLNGDDNGFENKDDNSYHVVHGNGTDSTSVLDGFIITGGNADFEVWPDDGGGGMNNHNGSPTVRNCTFSNNKAYADGGGMRNWGEESRPKIFNCTFVENSADQEGGGMMNGPGSKPTVVGCKFVENSAGEDGGGMYNNESYNSIIANCIFISNTANLTGGGMYNVNESSPNVINCSFSGNDAQKAGGAVYNNNGFPTLINCILWGNSAPTSNEHHNSETSISTVSYCNIAGGFEGDGNMDKDPLFTNKNLKLSAGSPCIDAGNNAALPGWLTTDFEGQPRILNGNVDIGAFEFQK